MHHVCCRRRYAPASLRAPDRHACPLTSVRPHPLLHDCLRPGLCFTWPSPPDLRVPGILVIRTAPAVRHLPPPSVDAHALFTFPVPSTLGLFVFLANPHASGCLPARVLDFRAPLLTPHTVLCGVVAHSYSANTLLLDRYCIFSHLNDQRIAGLPLHGYRVATPPLQVFTRRLSVPHSLPIPPSARR